MESRLKMVLRLNGRDLLHIYEKVFQHLASFRDSPKMSKAMPSTIFSNCATVLDVKLLSFSFSL